MKAGRKTQSIIARSRQTEQMRWPRCCARSKPDARRNARKRLGLRRTQRMAREERKPKSQAPRLSISWVKGDVHGSVEAVCGSILEIGSNEVQPRVLPICCWSSDGIGYRPRGYVGQPYHQLQQPNLLDISSGWPKMWVSTSLIIRSSTTSWTMLRRRYPIT